MTIEYRPATKEDAELLVSIYDAAFYNDYLRFGTCPGYGNTKESMERSIIDFPKFVILADGKPVGCVSSKALEAGTYEVGVLCVIPEFQGKGIGTQAIQFIKTLHEDWEKLTLVTPIDKRENVKFYTEKCGFQIVSTERDGDVELVRFVAENERILKILVFLAKGFETMEASVFIDVMGWARTDHNCNVNVVTCGLSETVVSAFGVPVTVDLLLNEVLIDEYDALAVPGGFEEYGFYEEAFSDEVSELIREFNRRNKPIASVCVAALALAHSGILTGKKATTYHLNGGRRQKQLAEYGVEVISEPIVCTDNIITSYCPETAPGVAFRLLGVLFGAEKMNEVSVAMGYGSLHERNS